MANQLKLKSVNQLLDRHFFIPYYQRGYRWTSQQVKQLLDDVWEYARKNEKAKQEERSFYCLQPVVVKPRQWSNSEKKPMEGYEVIDGQQRLTTLFILVKYLMKEHLKMENLKEAFHKELFSIEYETRPGSHIFLNDIKEDNSNVDYFYIHKAYQTTKEWFKDKDFNDKGLFLNALLGKKEHINSLQVIWYEVKRLKVVEEDIKDSKKLFNRLNLGKINLTNAELIKALFLASDKFNDDGKAEANRKKTIIAQLWDRMEKELNNKKFWAFITNNKQENYATKIELLFDFISGKPANERDYYFTFLHFLQLSSNSDKLWKVWQKIELYFNTLSEWHKDRDKYHNLGFLITAGESVKDLLEAAVKQTKDRYVTYVKHKISQKIDFNISELDYAKAGDKKKIEALLLLFNVETTKGLENTPTFYPFQLHKKHKWSIEHIQAQNSDNFNPNKRAPWLEWIAIHLDLLKNHYDVQTEANLEKTIRKLENVDADISWDNFQKLFQEVIQFFEHEEESKTERLHTISNLALLTNNNNAALNNAVFLAKRNKIIELDKSGSYIPICTRRLFFRYYGDPKRMEQVQFWTAADRKSYFVSMLEVLRNYLNDENKTLLERLKN